MLELPKNYRSVTEEEMTYDGSGLDGWAGWQKGLLIAGIVVVSSLTIYGIARGVSSYMNSKKFSPGASSRAYFGDQEYLDVSTSSTAILQKNITYGNGEVEVSIFRPLQEKWINARNNGGL